MKHFVISSPSGQILRFGSCSDGDINHQQVDKEETLCEGTGHWSTHYVLNEVITLRPANSAMLNGMVLSNLPVPCTIHVNDSSYACSDTTADLSFTYPGTYLVRVEAFPHLDATFRVTV